MMHEEKHIFPRRVSRDYHDIPKPRQKSSSFHKQRSFQIENPQNIYKVTHNARPKKKLDIDILRQQRQLLQHPAKISSDTPDWWKSTYKYFRRSQVQQKQQKMPRLASSRVSQQEKYFDVFNNKKYSFNTIQQLRSRRPPSPVVTRKVGEDITRSPLFVQKDVTGKIGSVEMRDYSIKKPLLKIGHNYSFIDTYSVK